MNPHRVEGNAAAPDAQYSDQQTRQTDPEKPVDAQHHRDHPPTSRINGEKEDATHDQNRNRVFQREFDLRSRIEPDKLSVGKTNPIVLSCTGYGG